MKQKDSWYLAFRFDPADDEGTETVTFIVGGEHRGGIAEGRLSWTGGLPIALADCLGQRVDRWISEAIIDQQVLLYHRQDGMGDIVLG